MAEKKIGNVPKTFCTQLYLSSGGCIICEKLKYYSFPEELIYETLTAMVENVLLPCTCAMWVQKKGWTLLENKQLLIPISWKRGGNSQIPDILETMVQQGYR